MTGILSTTNSSIICTENCAHCTKNCALQDTKKTIYKWYQLVNFWHVCCFV